MHQQPMFKNESCNYFHNSGVESLENISEFDFNFLTEYLLDEERHHYTNLIQGASGNQVPNIDRYPTELSDDDDYSSNDEFDNNKKRKQDGKSKTQDQLDRRRERNRVLARKTRLRKKFFFESLQRQVSQLSTENELLKGVIREKMDSDITNQILAECSANNTSSSIIADSKNSLTTPTTLLDRMDFKLITAIQAAQRSFVITDPALPDNPIIFASQGFLNLTLYSLNQVLGRNCRFMQGPGTNQSHIKVLREGVIKGEDTSVCLLNYKADGSTFYNQVFIAALRNKNMEVINFVGVQVEVPAPKPLDEKLIAYAKSQNALAMTSNPKLDMNHRSSAIITSTSAVHASMSLAPPTSNPVAISSTNSNVEFQNAFSSNKDVCKSDSISISSNGSRSGETSGDNSDPNCVPTTRILKKIKAEP